MRVWSFRALKHVAIFLVLLVLTVTACWFVMIRMPGPRFRGSLPPLTEAERALAKALKLDVLKLAGGIGPRNIFKPDAYRRAANLIERALANAGLETNRQAFIAQQETCVNLIGELKGTTRAEEIVVVGAHYDTCFNTPGANDNGSGVAALLALARTLAPTRPARTLRFVAFANEEPPFFQSAGMGGLVYAKACRARGDRIVAALSLETIGFYTDKPGSQRYPFPLSLFYPSRGNFVAFVSRTADAGLVRQCIASFRHHAQFPSEGAALPGRLPGIDWSDHWAFWQAGYPAIMVTDTAPFRYNLYHTDNDEPDRLDYERLARVVAGLEKVIEELANP